jgi:iron complex outermembrane recepter protein
MKHPAFAPVLCLLVILAIGPVPRATAQVVAAGSIEGRVVNPRSGEYLVNARVTLEGTGLEAFTESDGTYRLTNVPPGTARLKVFYTGLPVQTDAVAVAPGQTVEHNIALAPEAGGDPRLVKLDQFVVAEARDMDAAALAINEQRFAPNIKTVISTDDFGSTAETNVGEFLKFMPGLTVNYNGGNAREVSIAGSPPTMSPSPWMGSMSPAPARAPPAGPWRWTSWASTMRRAWRYPIPPPRNRRAWRWPAP